MRPKKHLRNTLLVNRSIAHFQFRNAAAYLRLIFRLDILKASFWISASIDRNLSCWLPKGVSSTRLLIRVHLESLRRRAGPSRQTSTYPVNHWIGAKEITA